MFALKPEEYAVIISVIALIVSIFTFWYSNIRKGQPIFSCSRWTAIGLEVEGKQGSAFAVRIGINNNGNSPIEIIDFLLVAETHKGQIIIYDPILLFDLTYY